MIYLATKSKARRELFKIFGIPFKVLPGKAKEIRRAAGIPYSSLVKKNALAKANEAAKKVNEGIIIAADTIVVRDGRIFGKPKNLKEAVRMLKALAARPQWLYTGVAVIDRDKKKTLLGYEKTKIYMDKLTDKEIQSYFKKVSPLDKAGSFDIQGKGAFFIRRVEGDFYNVVGLPLRKLYLMLKKLDIRVLVICVMCHVSCVIGLLGLVSFLSGCTTEYNIVTGEQETYYYSTEREVNLGEAIKRQVEREYKLAEDSLVAARVQEIGKKIAAVCDRKDIDYYFNVLDDEEVNAVSLPGGIVYVNKGLVDKVANDDELAGVLAHEVGHIVARHSIKKLQGMQAYSILRVLVAAGPSSSEIGTAADAAFTELLLGFSREDELLADQLGARYAKLAGYDPHGMISFLEKLQEINRRRPERPKSYFKTHPYVPDRIRVVKQELGESISFEDYINIEQEPHK
ncbi:MAG: Maf family nucleotide pyrophosphatase [Candidatus Omnitrophota bacterium]